MGSKGLWRHIEGSAVVPKPYVVADGTPVLSDGKTPATDEQIEMKEIRIADFEKREYLAQHIILSTTSIHLGVKIKSLDSAKAMWNIVKADMTTKSTLYILDAEDQLTSMKLEENNDPKTHLLDMKQHFQIMAQHHDNLIQMGSTVSDTRFSTIIMSSLPESYRPTLQAITAAERANKLSGGQSAAIKYMDPIDFLIEEAQHHVINDEHGKNAELALAAHAKRINKHRHPKKKRSDGSADESEEVCNNCHKPGHNSRDCWSKGGGKEGQGPCKTKGRNRKLQQL